MITYVGGPVCGYQSSAHQQMDQGYVEECTSHPDGGEIVFRFAYRYCLIGTWMVLCGIRKLNLEETRKRNDWLERQHRQKENSPFYFDT